MKETAIAFATFFMTILFVIIIRLSRRYRNIKMRSDRVTGDVMFTFDLCCAIAECGALCGQSAEDLSKCRCCESACAGTGGGKSYQRKLERKRKETKEYKEKAERAREVEEFIESGYTTKEEEKDLLLNLVGDKQETKLVWLNTVTMIPIEKIVEILAKEPDYSIHDDVVINNKLLREKEQETTEEIESTPEIKERAKGFCPACGEKIVPGANYCKNCGYSQQ